jgi:hypothetical protein
MGALRFCLSLAGIALFVACAVALLFGAAAAAFGGQSLSWATNLGGWLFAALVLVVMLRWAVIWLERRGREG